MFHFNFPKVLTTAAFSLAVLGCAPLAVPQAHAGDQPNILVMGEDADIDTVPRNSRIFNRVLRAMEGELQAMGFRVYDETATTMDITDPARVRRTDAEILTVASRVQDVPIDVATVFQIYANAERNAHADIMDLRARISGRLLNVRTGQALGNYEVSYRPGDLPPLPANCDRDCVLESVGEEARRIGADVANVLARQLDNLSPAGGGQAGVSITGDAPLAEGCTGMTTGYQITFRHFDAADLNRVEEYLVSFRGYDHHRPMRSSASETTYWYESCSEMARLTRNLRLMAEHMDVDADIRQTGNRYEIVNIRPAGSRN